ncbi:LamB/YcsF family protein [Amycolatopsis rhizosphaerae]|uniref:5-oxoprolinase subunit A n=1 Tax=Amycolatopsis rhizosphaerae TaxID=2053003 RepID=A0A558CVL5_9PSEU|nr:5-oxoprolinase subunit PxpA [Amycolatopsis rhizosphaerae]TVT52808.1 LamB/YcsF family protein [Amycolatopsis rhizosphaerae]
MDLNADLGEGFGQWGLGDDEALLRIVTSANIACGFHAGDPGTMRRACRLAVQHGVAIGAHVGYRDLAGFGRRFLDVEPRTLVDEIIYQISALSGIARSVGGTVTYVKPHGALYDALGRHEAQARATVTAIRQCGEDLAVLGLAGSPWLGLARQAGLKTLSEAFADRAYTPDGKLVSRREPGAVLMDEQQIAERCVRLATGQPIEAIDGTPITVRADSVCVHGDTPGAVAIAQAVRARLLAEGVPLSAVSGPQKETTTNARIMV